MASDYSRLVEKLSSDPSFTRSCFELILGSPSKEEPNSSGFLEYECPFEGCHANTNHFGVCYTEHTRTPSGFWSCFKCGAKGWGFIKLCEARGIDAIELSNIAVTGVASSLRERKKPLIIDQPLSPEEFSIIWKWVKQNLAGLSPFHQDMLRKRGLDLEKLPGWYSFDSNATIVKAGNFFGQKPCEKASVLIESNQPKPHWFCEYGRLAIVYPDRPWDLKGSLEYLSSYKSGATRKILRPTGMSTKGVLYNRADPTLGIDSLAIMEGEIKSECSYHAGVPTLGLLGMTNGHKELVDAIRYLLNLTNKEFPRRVLVTLDTEVDQGSIKAVENAADSITRRLRTELGKSCPIIERRKLPIFKKGTKSDSDGWIRHQITEESLELETARSIYRKFMMEGDL